MAEDARPNLPRSDPDSVNEKAEEPGSGPAGSEMDCSRLDEAARRTRAKANRYAAQHLGDGLEGEEILQDVLRSAIAAASHRKIERREGYLFRGVVRRIHDLLSRKPAVEYVGSAPELDTLSWVRNRGSVHEVERDLLIEEIIAPMDEETREIHFRRAKGDPWSSIAADLGITKDAAAEPFRYGIEKVRARVLGTGRVRDPGNAQGGDAPLAGGSRPRRT